MIQEEERYLDLLEGEKLKGLFAGTRGEARFQRRYQESNGRLEGYEKELGELPGSRSLDITFLRDPLMLSQAWEQWKLAEQREILGLVLERVWVIKARTSGVRPSVNRFRFWWVGEEEPQGIGAPTTLSEEPGEAI